MVLNMELEEKEERRRGRDTGVWDGLKTRSGGARAKSQ